jgi:hypothetical protein
VRREANWACKSESRTTQTEASPPTLGGEDGEAVSDDWRTTSAQVRDCEGRGEPTNGGRLGDLGQPLNEDWR